MNKPWIVIFLGFTNTNISYFPSAIFIPLLFYQPLAFWRKMYPPPFFEE